MYRKNNGITLVTLIFVIIVLIILASIFVSSSLNSLNEARKSEIQNEIQVLENAMTIRYASYLKNNGRNDTHLIGKSPLENEKLDTYSKCIEAIEKSMELNNSDLEKMKKNIENHFDEYVKIITSDEAIELGVEQYNNKSVYIVDYLTSIAYGPIIDEFI